MNAKADKPIFRPVLAGAILWQGGQVSALIWGCSARTKRHQSNKQSKGGGRLTWHLTLSSFCVISIYRLT